MSSEKGKRNKLSSFWAELKRRKVMSVAITFDRLRGNPRFEAVLED